MHTYLDTQLHILWSMSEHKGVCEYSCQAIQMCLLCLTIELKYNIINKSHIMPIVFKHSFIVQNSNSTLAVNI